MIQDALYTEISIADDGIGNFFVSKVIRKFAIWSQAHVFVSGRYSEEELIQSHLIAYYTKLSSIGTMVVMKLGNDSACE
ncbi:hypothetical protein [Dorea formicigenerans]|uniref:hypothetical protein n=1 Tax=Dorea formicigenerans TaxID=39486 RepID=UPI0005D26953